MKPRQSTPHQRTKKACPKKKTQKKSSKKTGKAPTARRARLSQERTYLYVLAAISNTNRSYVGVTNDIARRMRQHNGEIAGGARYTTRFKPWRLHAMFQLRNRHDALSLEWKVKHRKNKSDGSGVAGRVSAAIRLGTSVLGFIRCF